MILLRSLVYFLGLVLSVLLFGVAVTLVGWAIPEISREKFANLWGDVNMWMLRVICGLDYRVNGDENIPDGSAIVMAKHQSAWETIALRSIIRGKQSWVLKRELMWVPVFGWALTVMRPIAIDRKAGRHAVKQIIDQGTRYLNDGRNVIIFPEGTRTAPGTPGRYGIGGGLLAEHSGRPVVPVAHNAGVFWRRRDIRKYPGTIDVVVGPPIETQGKKASAIMREVENWIEGEMARLPQGVTDRQ